MLAELRAGSENTPTIWQAGHDVTEALGLQLVRRHCCLATALCHLWHNNDSSELPWPLEMAVGMKLAPLHTWNDGLSSAEALAMWWLLRCCTLAPPDAAGSWQLLHVSSPAV